MKTPDAPVPKSVEQLATQVFNELHQTVISHESGSLDGNIESIHDMRVAIRRLRVALGNFAVCVPKKDRKRLRVEMKNLADALGGVRDLDVMIAAMKASLFTRSDEEKSAISDLIRRLRAKRGRRLQVLRNYLQREEYAAFRREFPSERLGYEILEQHLVHTNIQPEVIEEEHGQAA